MIREITSSLQSFKSLSFEPGLNIVVAERHKNSGVRDTRNGTGKTSLIELIHFIFSESKQSASDFHKAQLSGYDFSLVTSEAGGLEREFTKSVTDGVEQLRVDGVVADKKDMRRTQAINWFDLSADIIDQKYSPTFSAMFAYFVRKERNGGFANATNNSSQQQGWDMQVNLSYLLGFDWHLPQVLQNKKDRKKAADELFKMLKGGLLSDFELDPQRMQARFDILEDEIERKRKELREAEVVDDYRGREEQANAITRSIRTLNEQNLLDLDLIEDINSALEEVASSDEQDIVRMYKEAGIFFSEKVFARFDQVRDFHAAVSNNRRKHLDQERTEAKLRLAGRKREISGLQSKLKEHMLVLKSGIAIERYASLQSELNSLEREFADLDVQIPRIRNVEEERKKLKSNITNLVDLIGQDVLERKGARTEAIRLFADISRYLYDEPGELIIGKSKGVAGLAIETNIRAKKSGGKSHMQIFCFDLMLAIIAKSRDKFPGFLVHDSHIFDGVDGRQIGLALEVARQKCNEHGIQYIVTMNSDDLEKIRHEETISGAKIFDPAPYINSTRLSDSEHGGLFGIRF